MFAYTFETSYKEIVAFIILQMTAALHVYIHAVASDVILAGNGVQCDVVNMQT